MANMTWGDYRDLIRTIGLPSTFVVSSEVGVDTDKAVELAAKLAFNELCAHTAKTVEFLYDASVTNPVDNEPYDLNSDTIYRVPYLPYPLPRTIKRKSWVYINDVLVDTSLYYWDMTYENLIWLSAPQNAFELRYYAYYSYPENSVEGDLLNVDIPDWSLGIVRHRIVSHILSMASVESADIRQWGTRRDSGTPDNNPLAARMMDSERMYKLLLDAVAPQNKEEVL